MSQLNVNCKHEPYQHKHLHIYSLNFAHTRTNTSIKRLSDNNKIKTNIRIARTGWRKKTQMKQVKKWQAVSRSAVEFTRAAIQT